MPHREICYADFLSSTESIHFGDELERTSDVHCTLCQYYPLSRTPTPERFDQLNFSCLVDSERCPRNAGDSDARNVLANRSINCVGNSGENLHVSQMVSANLLGNDSKSKGNATRKRKRSAPPPPPNSIPKSMDVISAEEYSSLGRSAKRKYEIAYSNSEGTYYGLKSSRLETPQEFITQTRNLYKELDRFSEENARPVSLPTAATAVGITRNFIEADSGVECEEFEGLRFEDLINLDIWDGEE
ncbi:hypothetical protein M413DRAFT_26606 [Hebeloma cylindrosporum]|uniref:Uncharacterized protein n=1 Tax=Hebeloma cylindrosporum TaxID=76867 RepID=A0A0C3CEC8_HEBCY|nr:hypothetical protein M413DRAFT_26606 [Hebeloma cylindrosporum h7]